MAYQVYINGVDRTNWLKVNSCSWSSRLNGKSSMSCQLEDLGRGFRPRAGQSIRIDENGTPRFGGVIQRPERHVHPGSSYVQYEIQASDYTAITDRRRVTGSIGADTLQVVVEWIVQNFLEDEGITTTNVALGPIIQENFDFNNESVTDAFNKIAAATGYLWYIDPSKNLYFSLFAATPAPFGIAASSDNWYDLSVAEDTKDYRNQQYARTEYNVQADFTITQPADGTRRDYFTDGPIMNAVPTVTVNGAAQTVGRFGADPHLPTPAYDCYYDVNGVGVHWPAPLSPPANGAVLVFTVTMDFTNLTMAQNAAEIAARQAVEGGSGKYQAIREERNISTLLALQALAEGELAAKGTIPEIIEFSTRDSGLLPGQLININLPLLEVNADYLIESVGYRWIAAAVSANDFYEHRVSCTSAPVMGTSTNLFKELVRYSRIGAGGSTTIESDVQASYV